MDELLKRGYEQFVKIDAGGQANVYRTVKNGVVYAIKVVRVENPLCPKLDDDLKRELTIVRNLKHPNCIKIEELFRTRSKIYIIMEFMPNGTIGSLVRKHPSGLCEWNAKLWFCPIALAIRYLHSHNIAHRDLKLDNILLDRYLNAIVTDYGYSRFVSFTEKGTVQLSYTYCGTMSYNPPEILKQIPYDAFKADIWCLGVMLFILLNHVYPFERRDKSKMVEHQMRRQYRLRTEVEERTSAEVRHLIDFLLEPEAPKRPSIKDVCSHVWFPIVHQEAELLKPIAPTAEASPAFTPTRVASASGK